MSIEPRYCQNCKELIVQRTNENNFRYKTRKFCSDKCYHEYYKSNKLGWYQGFGVKREKDE